MSNTNIIIYQTEDGRTKIETRLENETVWLSINQMAELFQKCRSSINKHIIYEEQYLDFEQSMRKIGNSDFSTKLITIIYMLFFRKYVSLPFS